ncbi:MULTISPECIES: ABC transporter permease [Nocardiaceae]|uniref:ABC transporter permease n=1 Tax=Nocardiaceae TaxID=85025 RepID=UPI000522E6E1|nr:MULTISPECIES: ABC transporter permease [Rhodococcus]OZC78534.1 ABC transporter permease [Rhodococcus sp. 06-418-1B]OZD10831.1 ABC transporter permease [Rhodococcus sp. 06-156-4C]OZD11508.1 ABC transporter permease [Rhodococcus sp. 06-156-3C]OZD13743.1 ABC transporter permease [Rhodococcus sp. 06-156-4a]OZD28110.1 ABC transporter permease [Rhodococcus sp. 06-156-3b]
MSILDRPRTATVTGAVAVLGSATKARNGYTVAALLFVLLIAAWAIAPGLFTSQDPYLGITADKFLPPSWSHLFGTDQLGRDILTRVIHGTRSAVLTALLAVAIGSVAGSIVGLVAGFFGRGVDAVLGRVIDTLLAIPGFLLAVIVVVSLGFASVNAAIAVGISSIAVFARLIRSETLRVKNSAFVESSKLIGGGTLTVLFQHVLPNVYRSVLALAVLQFGLAIINVSALAFLGYGNPPPSPDWGLLVAEGKDFFYRYPWFVYAPGVVMVASVLALQQLSKSIGNKDR